MTPDDPWLNEAIARQREAERERNLSRRSWLYRWHLNPSHTERFLNEIMGRGPLQRLDDWLFQTVERWNVEAGVPEDSKGYDWPWRTRALGKVFIWVQDIDTWFKTRDWYHVDKRRLPPPKA